MGATQSPNEQIRTHSEPSEARGHRVQNGAPNRGANQHGNESASLAIDQKLTKNSLDTLAAAGVTDPSAPHSQSISKTVILGTRTMKARTPVKPDAAIPYSMQESNDELKAKKQLGTEAHPVEKDEKAEECCTEDLCIRITKLLLKIFFVAPMLGVLLLLIIITGVVGTILMIAPTILFGFEYALKQICALSGAKFVLAIVGFPVMLIYVLVRFRNYEGTGVFQ